MDKINQTRVLKRFLLSLNIMDMVEETEEGYRMKHDLKLSKAMIIMDYLTIKEITNKIEEYELPEPKNSNRTNVRSIRNRTT